MAPPEEAAPALAPALAPAPAYNLLPPPTPMSMKGDLADNWRYFHESWSNYSLATDLGRRGAPVEVATLLSVMGRDAHEVYKNLDLSDDAKKDPKEILKGLDNHFVPSKNVIFERYMFNSATQDDDSIEGYLNRLRKLASTCKFGNLCDELIRDRLVIGVKDNGVRRRMLRESELTLVKALDIARAAERTTVQMRKLEGDEPIHAVKTKRTPRPTSSSSSKTCKYCGQTHERGKCPAYGKTCAICKKSNHFAKVCRSKAAGNSTNDKEEESNRKTKKIHQLEEFSSDEEYDSDRTIYAVKGKGSPKYIIRPALRIPGKRWCDIKLQIDNGASVNCLLERDFNNLAPDARQHMRSTDTTLTSYSGDPIKPIGEIKLEVKIDGKETTALFMIIPTGPCSLLSGATSEALQIMTIRKDLLIHLVSNESISTKEEVLKQYKDVFIGLGDIGQYHIDLDEKARPVQDAPRTVPVALRDELKRKLKQMVAEKILAKVDEPTDWISSAVYVKKPGKLRVCLDPKQLNKHVQIPKYRMPTLDDITSNIAKAKIFSVCDAKDGFLQVRLDDASANLTTFHTPFGRHKWLRLPFGICSAPEEFQRRTLEILEGLKGVYVKADDVLITGEGDTLAEATADHDENFLRFMDRCREKNFKLNKEKLRFKQSSVRYHGHILSSDGIKPDPEKVEAVTEMPRPRDKAGVRTLLGLVNYMGKFCPHLSDVSEPLRELTKQESEFHWSAVHDEAFKKIQSMLTQAPILRYYDLDEEVTIEADASDYGLGAVLLQNKKPVEFASRVLTSTERRYSQIEKEALALTFACERFNQYVFGRELVTAITDHKPLEMIMLKSINSAPKRLQRMMLRLQKYKLKVIHRPGKTMLISDHLSRNPLPNKQPETEEQFQIFMLAEELQDIDYALYHNVSDQTLKEVADETAEDEGLQQVAEIIMDGWPQSKFETPINAREYWPYRDELSCQNGVLYRGTRVIIPMSMRRAMLEKLHASHQGIEASRKKSRDHMFWPTISTDIKNTVDRCSVCQENMPKQAKEPMKSQPIPKQRWSIVSTDLLSFQSAHYLVTVDHFSKFFEVDKVEDTTAETIIDKLKSHFARHGIPDMLISDNGPQFSCREFKVFTREWKFHHQTSSPHHPEGNGTAEAAVKSAKNLLRKADDFWLAMLEHRNTPNVQHSPAQKLLDRRTKSLVPTHPQQLEPRIIPAEEVMNSIMEKKQSNKQHYDKGSRKQLPQLDVGEDVRVKLHPESSKKWSCGKIEGRSNGRSYIIESEGRKYRRNRTHVRSTKETFNPGTLQDEDEDDLPIMAHAQPAEEHEEISEKPPGLEIQSPMVVRTRVITRSGRVVKPNRKYED